MAKRPKRPRDPNQLAKLIVEIATGHTTDSEPKPETDATLARRRGGMTGGRARAKKIGAKRRREIAKKAARIRWGKT